MLAVLGTQGNVHVGLLGGCWRPSAMPMCIVPPPRFVATAWTPLGQAQPYSTSSGCSPSLAPHLALDVPEVQLSPLWDSLPAHCLGASVASV